MRESDAPGIRQAVQATESKFLKWITPVLLGAIAVLGWRMYDNLTGQLNKLGDGQEQQQAQTAEIKSDVRDINTRLTYSVVKDVDDLKTRVKTLENATKTP